MFSLYRYLKIVLRLPLAALGLPPTACRHTPSCSRYCEQSLKQFGPFKGSWMCFTRVLSCNPL